MPFLLPSTLQFGVRIPPDHVGDPVVSKAHSFYYRWLAVISIVLVGANVVVRLSKLGSTPSATAWYTGVFFLAVVACYLNYYVTHRRLHNAKEAAEWYKGKKQVIMADTSAHQQMRRVSYWWAAPSVIISLITLVVGIIRYPNLPNRIAIHFDLNGVANGWAHKSVLSVFSLIILQFLLIVVTGLINYSIQRGSIRIDPAEPEHSRRHQERMQRQLIRVIWILIAFTNLTMLFGSLSIWGVWNHNSALSSMITIFPIVLGGVVVVGIALWSAYQRRRRDHEHHGDALKKGHVHRDDDRYWKGGGIYFNPDDPAILVPKRFGIGWTFNFAHPIAWVILAAIIAIPALISIFSK